MCMVSSMDAKLKLYIDAKFTDGHKDSIIFASAVFSLKITPLSDHFDCLNTPK